MPASDACDYINAQLACAPQGVAEGDAEIPSGEVVPLEYNLVRMKAS